MQFAFACTFILALFHFGSAVTICNNDMIYNSTLKTPCVGNDVAVLWPNYENFATYYQCIKFGKAELQTCPRNKYFTYYYQQCTDCAKFIPPPQCEFLKETTDVTCIPNGTPPKTTTKAPITTTTKGPITTTTKGTTVTKTPRPTKSTPFVPTPPTDIPPTSGDIPMPPNVVTPVPGIPTPPNENVTPPSIPGVPPLLTTVASP